ncbi:MAG: hypothetical protein LW860_21075 [Xanthomonadaceae bacterium]|nr:hypothetical protein [Xanthomonadaceae bacterium]
MARWMIGIVLGVLLFGVLGVVGMAIRSHVTARPAPDPVPAATTVSAETDPTPQGDPDAAARGGADAASAPRRMASPLPAPASTAAQPLPPLDAPVADILDTLEQRARAGDARAACRLASELGRCGSLQRRRAMDLGRSLAEAPPRQISDEMVDVAARISVALEADERACAGVAAERTADAVLWLQRAAAGQHLPSMVAFAAGVWMAGDSSFVAHPEVVATYARDAVPMALATLEAGDPTLANALGLAYAGRWSGTPLDRLVPRDDAQAYALLAAAGGAAPAPPMPIVRRMPQDPHARTLADLEASLGPEQRARAESERARLAALFAEGAKRRQKTDPPLPRQFNMSYAIAPHDCDR